MKKVLSFLAMAIALVLLTINPVSAFSTGVLDSPDFKLDSDGFVYIEKETKNNNLKQKIFYGEYNTTGKDAKYEWVIHSIRDGSNTTLTNVMDIAKDYEATTGRKVMLATNGDYFYATGSNVDSYVNNGIVISKGNMAQKNCIGFDNNGKVVVGRMTEVETRLVIYNSNGQPQQFEINKYNQQPAEGEIAIYNTPGTYTVANAGVMIVKSSAANLNQYPVWGTDYTMTAPGVQESKSFKLNSGQYAVVYTAAHNDTFAKHTFGEAVDLVEIPAGKYQGCTWVVGGYDVLVNNYQVNTNCHSDNAGDANAPRTFIGFKEDGTGFLCVVDGRQSGYSIGITVNQEAELAAALGAQYALELDGGGSSTVILRVNDELTLRNKPSDGPMRAVSNALLLVEKEVEEETNPDNAGDENTPESDLPATPPTENNGVDVDINEPTKKVGPFAQFFINIWEAIKNFFKNLFSKKA